MGEPSPTISRAEANNFAKRGAFRESDVFFITEVTASPKSKKKELAKEIATELGQGAGVCENCSRIHFARSKRCPVCRLDTRRTSQTVKTPQILPSFAALTLGEQARKAFQERRELLDVAAQEEMETFQRVVDTGDVVPKSENDGGFFTQVGGAFATLLGLKTPPQEIRPPTRVVYRENKSDEGFRQLPPPSPLARTSHDSQFLRPPTSPSSNSFSISSPPRFHPLDVLKQDVSSPVFFGHQNKLGHLFIIGGSTSGKTYAVSWLAQLFHSIRHYKSILYITKRASYLNAGPSFRAMFAEKQVIFLEDWNGRLPELMERLKQTFTQLRKGAGSAFKFSLCIFDDVTAEVTTGKLNLVDFFTTGRHWGTDFWLVLHSVPKFTAGSASILRQSVCAVIAFGQQIAPRLCDIAEYVDKGDAKEAEAYIKSFTNNDAHIGVFLEVGKGGSIYDYIHPFQAGKLEEPSYVGFPVGNPEKWGVLASIPTPPSLPTPSAPPAPNEEKHPEASECDMEDEGDSEGEDL